MTLAELERLIASKQRTEKARAQERASFDYILADLIGRSIARVHSSSATMPAISEAYPTLFDNQAFREQQAAKKAELSVLRFKLFAEAHNNKIKEAQKLNE